jgi:hypothetical protein
VNLGGFLTKDLGYCFNENYATFWRLTNPGLTKVNLGFQSAVLAASILSSGKHILILTVEEIHVYEMKLE